MLPMVAILSLEDKMMHNFTAEELQQFLKQLGEEVQITSTGTHNLLAYPEGLRIAMPAQWPVDADGSPKDIFCPFDEQDYEQLRQALGLTDEIASVDVAAGQWRDGIFWLFQPGDFPTHILVALNYQYGVQSALLFREFNTSHQTDWSDLTLEHPYEFDNTNARGIFLAQSQHVLMAPPEVMPLLHSGAIFSGN